ncbi:PREDICTED: cadherin-related family member 5 [Propithecus coquereli]|uniref:cadherin-related family member 5 n=1 Tax=Propithecus coquereli TaxID=379532 RepID=UPI00063FA324|nr:PREDICTED: cadherin-related family member 5 [Propithecus coquereli]
MGAWAQPWPPLLLMALLGRPPGAEAQAQVCSVSKTFFEIEENTNFTEPLVDILVPGDQQVTLGSSSTLFAFRILENQLFLNVTPDYEENPLLQAHLECKRRGVLVTQLRVFVAVLDLNDNAPVFPFATKETAVEEDTKVNSTVIPETALEAEDADEDDILFYTLQEVTVGARDLFSLLGANRPVLRLDRPLDVYKWPNMTFRLLVRDTAEENAEPSHTATATLVLQVLPADLRPPWFLPCAFSDGYVCLQAQYRGAVPTGHKLPAPLVLRPGPIYAEDGDRSLNQRIIYGILSGNVNGTFALSPDSGNLTMAQSVPSPTTFLLVVKAEQADLARYSVTQVTVEVLAATGSLPGFPQSLYRGTVARGSGVGVAVRDAAAPSQLLRIQAQDPDFPDLNSAITYQVTNHSDFRMDGEFMLTTTSLAHLGVFYAEVEAKNTVTLGTATTVVEIQVSEQEPPSTGMPDGGLADGKRFSVGDMATLGGVLGVLLLLALLGLVVLVHKHYGQRLKCCSHTAPDPQTPGFDNQAFANGHEANWAPAPSPGHVPKTTEAPPTATDPAPREPPASPALPSPGSPAVPAGGSPTAVRSILTKERRPQGGYKAVWFGEDIGAEADVVVLNAPSTDADGAGDSGDEDAEADSGRGGSPHD